MKLIFMEALFLFMNKFVNTAGKWNQESFIQGIYSTCKWQKETFSF